MGRIAIYPGSFDPVTYGHIDIIKRATQMFDRVIVAVARNAHKKPLFTFAERIDMLRRSVSDVPKVEVESFDGLVIDFAHAKKCNVLIRGLRMISDFEYELQMALTNRRLAQDVETVFMMPSESHSFVSSRLLKEAGALGADLSSFVPEFVEKKLQEKLKA